MAKFPVIRAAVLAVLAAPALAPAAWGQDISPGYVEFVNQSSFTVTIAVDGIQVCVVSPGSSCSTNVPLQPGIDAANDRADHPVRMEADDGAVYEDTVKVWECYANGEGIKSFIISDDDVLFGCG